MRLVSKHLQSKIWQLKCWHLVVTMFHTSRICIFCVHIFLFWTGEARNWIDCKAAFEFKITSQRVGTKLSEWNDVSLSFFGGCPASVSQLKCCGIWRKKKKRYCKGKEHIPDSDNDKPCVYVILVLISWIGLPKVTPAIFKFISWMAKWIWRA